MASSLAHSEYRARRTFGSLDGLRCLSIVAVVFHHVGPRLGGLPLAAHGYLGVDLFFAISGFLITTLLLREHANTGRVALPAFYVRRSLRIFPLYYAVLFVYVALVAVVERGSPEGVRFFENLPYFATYTSNWFVALDDTRVIFYFAWSLATEEQFYLMWPPVLALLGPRRAPFAMLGLLGLAYVFLFDSLLPILEPLLVEAPFIGTVLRSLMPPIAMGTLLAFVLHAPRGFATLGRLLGLRFASPLLLAAVIGVLALPEPSGPLVHVLMTLLVGASVVNEEHALARFFRFRPVAHVGVVSYGVYLFHMLVANVVHRVFGRFGLENQHGLAFVWVLAGAVLVATISHRTYEAWFLRWKDRFVVQRQRRVVRTPGFVEPASAVERARVSVPD